MSGAVRKPAIRQADSARLVGTDDMYEIAAEVFQRRLRAVDDVEDLVALDPWTDPSTGRKFNERARYELRMVQFHFGERGVAGVVTRRQFEAMIAWELELITNAQGTGWLQREQPYCGWQIVGAFLEQKDVNQTISVPFDGKGVGAGDWAALLANSPQLRGRDDAGEGLALQQQTKAEQRSDFRLVARLIYADLAHGDLTDPALNSPIGKPGPMTEYARSRSIRHLGDRTRLERDQMVRMLREFYAEPERVAANEEIEELLAPEPAKPKNKGGRPRKNAVAAPEVETRAQMIVRLTPRIVELRASAQMPPPAIARELDLTVEEVREALRAYVPPAAEPAP